jgi:site-specific DNA recombinase
MRAVIYCRVSTKEQTSNLSLSTQLKACREYCRRLGYAVALEFMEEGESAKTADRTELQRLLAYCREHKGQVQALVVYQVSRFARDRYDHAVVRALLQKQGVTLRSVTEQIDDSPTGKMLEGIVATFAQYDNDQKAERTGVGMRAALQLGRWTFKAPLGYLNTGAKTSPSLVHDPKRADLIRLAFAQVADGTTVADVLRLINAAGLTGAGGRNLSLQSFRSLLRNPICAGRIEVKKWGISRVGDFEPLVGEAVFRLVQRRMAGDSPEPKAHVRDRDDFPLRRFLRCGTCRKPVTGSWSKGRTGRYAYYHCPRCPGVRGRLDSVEKLFLAFVDTLRPDPGYLRLFRAIVLDAWRAEQARTESVEKLLTERVSELRERRDRVEDAFLHARTINQGTYERQRDRISEELAVAELELHDAHHEKLDVEGVLGFGEYLMANLGRMWTEGSLVQRQQLQWAIFPEGLSFNGREFGTAPTCLAFMQLGDFASPEKGMASPPGFEPGFQP